MIQLERHERIIAYLTQHEVLSVADAVTIFNASPATIRRDFNEMAQQNLVRRVRGGIKIAKPLAGDVLPFALRELRYSQEKEALAESAAGLLRPGEVVIIDGGTTTYFLSHYLPDFPLRVITNSLRLAAALEEKRMDRATLEVYITGGYLYPNSGLLLGPNSVSSLQQYHAHWAFIAVGGINEHGISNTNELVVETERMMIEHADKVVILADHSKIGKHAMCTVCGIDMIDILITDVFPENDPVLKKIAEAGVEILTVSHKVGGQALRQANEARHKIF